MIKISHLSDQKFLCACARTEPGEEALFRSEWARRYGTKGFAAIAREIGVRRYVLRDAAARLGIQNTGIGNRKAGRKTRASAIPDSAFRKYSNRVIAEVFGVPKHSVTYQRQARKLPPLKPTRRHDWANVDWSRRTSDIAKEMGVLNVCVSRARRIHAPETSRPKKRPMPSHDNTTTAPRRD